jgi:hypothetical protein
MTKEQRVQVARDHLTANESWVCTPDADLCPRCVAKEELAELLGRVPDELRRIAELAERVHDEAAGRPWSAHAASVDQAAHDALQVLEQEDPDALTPEETGERENALLFWLGPRTDDAPDTDR